MNETFLGLLSDIRTAREEGVAAIEQRQRARLAALIAYARANSPYYRELYQNLPERIDDPTLLPVTTKRGLMERFDDWVTDREVTLEQARAFVEDRNRIGELFLDKYLLALGSGTRGFRAIYLMMDNWVWFHLYCSQRLSSYGLVPQWRTSQSPHARRGQGDDGSDELQFPWLRWCQRTGQQKPKSEQKESDFFRSRYLCQSWLPSLMSFAQLCLKATRVR